MALDEDSLQDLMAVCSNGALLKEWSHADAIKAITLWSQAGPGILAHVIFVDMQLAWQWKKGRHGGFNL